MELGAFDFPAFFDAIHGYAPFPWQRRLVERLDDTNEWPDVLDLPTGSGKTAALDAAVFHLALRADKPAEAALRVALVVDRRLVVDDAHARATKIACELENPSKHPVLEEVARRLRRLAGEKAPPLIARRLRGGAPLEYDWARTPTQPTILCSTVDQVGSRLLFRGYGVSDRMKPVHAGLLGTDTLVLLDEAHLSEPFRETMEAVREFGGAGIKTVVLSATPGARPKRPLGLDKDDCADPTLKARLGARKPVRLRAVRGKAEETLAEEARGIAKRLRASGTVKPAVGVVVNRVALARAVFGRLEGDDDVDTILMIGRSRGVGRDDIVKRLEPFRTGKEQRRAAARPLFLVATQCLEVGVDLDLDGLVAQAASADALRQRFGRLNRAGRDIRSEGIIVAVAGDVAKRADDPVYGDRIRKTWEVLNEVAGKSGSVDFGIDALDPRLCDAGLAAPRAAAPVLMPAYLHLWSQTWPRPAADPEIGLFLHGAERASANVSVIWRGDVTNNDRHEHRSLTESMQLVSPRAAEAIEVPLWAARAWLRRARGALDDFSDAPEKPAEEGDGDRRGDHERDAFRWAGADDSHTRWIRPGELRPGDVIVVPCTDGGCDNFGWKPDSDESVEDVADRAAEPWRGRRWAVRVASDIRGWDGVKPLLQDENLGGLELVERLLDVLPRDTENGSDKDNGGAGRGRSVRQSLELLRRARGWRIGVYFPYAGGRGGGAVLVAERGIEDSPEPVTGAPATESDRHSMRSSKPVLLDNHGRRVARYACDFAKRVGLSDTIARDVWLAALLHDSGKADPRFQCLLSGGNIWNRPDGPPLAKSGRLSAKGAWERAGLPKGWRHEALSVQIVQTHSRLADACDPGLVLWLIGVHHGFGRPFFDFVDPQWEGAAGPHAPAFSFDGADWPQLFEALKRRYGIWRLAHLEAVLRLADHRASEEEDSL